MSGDTAAPDLLHQMDACWLAVNCLPVRQIHPCDNPLLKRPLALADEAGLRKLFSRFSLPGGIPSHAAPEQDTRVPGAH